MLTMLTNGLFSKILNIFGFDKLFNVPIIFFPNIQVFRKFISSIVFRKFICPLVGSISTQNVETLCAVFVKLSAYKRLYS